MLDVVSLSERGCYIRQFTQMKKKTCKKIEKSFGWVHGTLCTLCSTFGERSGGRAGTVWLVFHQWNRGNQT
jgi:hypothetical protein